MIQSAASMGIFVTARKCPRIVEPAISINTIQAVRRDSPTDFRNPFQLSSLLIRARRRTAKVPTLPASVGVKNPFMSPPMTRRKMIPTDRTSGREAIRSFQEDLLPLGPKDGLIRHHP